MTLNDDSKLGPLGRPTEYPDIVNPTILFPISRSSGRETLGLTKDLPFIGFDRWRCYEVSWLDELGIPQSCVAEINIPCHSPNIVESKSLKLFLGGFNGTRFSTSEVVKETIEKALAHTLDCSEILVELIQTEDSARLSPESAPGSCLDKLQETPTTSDGVYYSDNFRSLCPVTRQPDWATVIVHCSPALSDPLDLREFLYSLRESQEFHERCCEEIFCHLLNLKPEILQVGCYFLRRGGIEISPVRHLASSFFPVPVRLLRQ